MAQSAISIAVNLVSKLGECLFAPIGRQFGYVLLYKSYVKDLKSRVEKLESARERVQHSVQEAKNNGKLIENDIQKWLESVENEATLARDLLKHGESAKNACFYGWLPNPKVRHPIGRKVKKMTQVIRGLHDESIKNIFQKVYYEHTPIGIVPAPTSTARSVEKKEEILQSRAKILEEVIRAIVDDKVCVIGVYGPGGVGKSKLLKDIEREVREESLFHEVAMANISCNPDLKRIQGEIAYAIGLKLINEETALGRADLLCKRLESDPNKNILIILDDLWNKLELKDIGIPCGDGNKVRGCKLLLTSRNRNVLRTSMGSDREFQLNVLEHEEARRLFERMAGDRVNSPEFEPWVDGVVKNCGGLPLLIVSLGKRLKHKDLATWRNASTSRDLSDVKSLVELSYNDLKDERIKSLFLICALTSGRISTRDLLVYCMGLGLFKSFSKTIQNARDRLIDDLHSLQDSSLLLESDDTELFKMHDIFVDVAISMHDEFMDMKWNALVGKKDYGFKEWSEDDLRKCTAISFFYVGMDELPEKLDCPNLRMLLLFENNTSLIIPESFFESMKKLQVLHFAGFSFTSLTSSVQFPEHLKSLSLDFCHLEDVTLLGKLKGLQFLSFTRSTIARLPKEIGELTQLRCLDLTWCFRLEIIEPSMLGSLINLEELYIDSFHQWEAEDAAARSNASLAELKNMKKLRTLYIAIPDSTNLSSDLPFGNLNEHKIQIGGIEHWWGENKESRTLKLKLDSSNLLHEVWMQDCLGRTQDLCLDGLQDGRDSIHDLCTKGFQDLKHLHVKNNLSFHYVVDSTQCPTFTRLESLFLENLNNLEKICRDFLAPKSFVKLKTLKVENCGEIKHLFPSSMTRIFLQLEEIEITTCQLMQQIVAGAEANEHMDEIDDDANLTPCKLRRLTLQNLPEMTSFYKTRDHSVVFLDGQQVSLPWLESLTLSELPKLKEIWNSQFPLDVSNLKFFKIEDCAILLSIIPSNLLIKLHNLEAITIKRCQLVHEVFNLGGLTSSEDVEILSRLTKLTLGDLPRLEHLLNKNPRRALCFRNLSALKVQNCEHLKFLFSSSMAKAFQQIKEIEIASCKLLEEIMDIQEEESREATYTGTIEFPLLTSLSLKELPNLKRFSYGTYLIYCPTLSRLRIFGCPKMMTFSSLEGKQQLMTADTYLQQVVGCTNSSLFLLAFFNQNVLFPSLEKLTLVSLCALMRIWHNELSEESFCKLASITVQDCENLSHIFPSTLIEKFQSLRMIEVVKCTSLKALIEPVAVNTKKRQKSLVFSHLREVKLWDLPRLNAFVTSNTKATFGLPSLTNVSLRCCHNLRYLFINDTSRTLGKLEMLNVFGCNNMQEVVATEESEKQKPKAVKFSHLRILKLCSLKGLISFSSGSCAYEFPSLIKLSILECTRLKAFILRPQAPRVEMTNEGSTSFDEIPNSLFDEKVIFRKLEELRLTAIQSRVLWENEMPNESICQLKRLLHHMRSLSVEECPRLRNLFTMSMAKSLAQLKYLGLGGCGEMEYIVAREEKKLEEAADIIVFPQLFTLHLHNMIKLRSFCHGKHTLKWPSLKQFTVEDCKAVEIILGDANCRRPEGYIPMHQPLLLVDKVEFPSMESMKILHMNNVEKIWHDELASNAFNKLKTLKVKYCDKLLSIFPSYTILTKFQNLEKIIVTDCGSLEVIFHVQDFNFSEDCSTRTFQLRELILRQLPKMKHVWRELPQGGLTFGELLCMKVVKCESLKSLFPSLVAKSMTQLEVLIIRDCMVEEIISKEDGVGMSAGHQLFSRLIDLKLLELPELRSFYMNSHTSTWPLLKQLRVRHCGKIRSFSFVCEIQSWQGTTAYANQPALLSFEKAIPHLEGLTLRREDVAMMPQHYIFDNLRYLSLACFHDENVAFPSDFLLQRFPNLEELDVTCSSFDGIFPEDAFGHGGVIWKDNSLMDEILKQIEFLSLWQCPSLSIVFPSPASLQRLTKLQVEDCPSLVHMGTCSAVTNLVHLTSLTLTNCDAIEGVVIDDGNVAKEISFPKLQQLILDGLSSFESFSTIDCTFMFPSLVRIIVKQCPKMKIFCKGALRTPQLDKVLVSFQDNEGHWEGDLNITIQTLST
ncbi:hypothetical protein ACJRO7_011253 [Eucalyptus globulus]|uniref:AAA+ ATPase domain-containing protein n=1 Tax=Eucalyptus globulus TaxID=34317 RepID=A0ABD3LK16_EUCGL